MDNVKITPRQPPFSFAPDRGWAASGSMEDPWPWSVAVIAPRSHRAPSSRQCTRHALIVIASAAIEKCVRDGCHLQPAHWAQRAAQFSVGHFQGSHINGREWRLLDPPLTSALDGCGTCCRSSRRTKPFFLPLAWGKLSLRIVSRGLTQHPPQFNASASLALEPPWPWAALTLESRMSRAYSGHEKCCQRNPIPLSGCDSLTSALPAELDLRKCP